MSSRNWYVPVVWCDTCATPIVHVDKQLRSTIVHPMVCLYGVTLCSACASDQDLATLNVLDVAIRNRSGAPGEEGRN
jgi:hypothetical protein